MSVESSGLCSKIIFDSQPGMTCLDSNFGHRSSIVIEPHLETFGSEVVGSFNRGQERKFILGRGAAPSVGTQVVFKRLSIMSS